MATGADPIVPPVPGLRELDGVWTQPRGDRHEGGPAPPADPRRRAGRASRWPRPCAASAARWRSSRAPSTCSPASPRRWARRSARPCAATASSCRSACTPTAARRDGDDYVLEFDDGRELRGDRLLVATGRRPRVEGIGLETVGIEADPHGIPVDAHLRAGERLWAIGDVTGIWPLTHVGEYEGDVVAANILGEPRAGELRGRSAGHLHRSAGRGGRARSRRAFSAHRAVSDVPKTATYTHAYAESNGFLTLLSDGERLTGAYALGPEAGEWLQQATLAIRAHVPLEVLQRHDPAVPELLGDLRRRR